VLLHFGTEIAVIRGGGTGYEKGSSLFYPPHPNPLPQGEGIWGNPVVSYRE